MKPFSLSFFTLLVCLPLVLSAQTKIERLEPAFWWAGMQDSQLQLMVYGENIAATNPQLDYPGVQIQQIIKVKSPNYLFLDLILAPDVQPGTFSIAFHQDDKPVATYDYELKQRKSGSAEREGFNPSDVIYLITPDRFANGNPDNDNTPDTKEQTDRSNKLGRHGGDIQGIVDHLDYIKNLGFTAIWLNPVLENNMQEVSYHGYSTTDFYRVDPRFGSNEEYQQLNEVADEKGIKLVMDMILNHCGSEHWWMNDLPTNDWINFPDEYNQTNHRRTTIQDPYRSSIDYKKFSDGWFVPTMPDLNQNNPLMARYLIQNSIWWIEYAGLEGIRMDTYSYPDKDFMSDWTCAVMNEYPNFNIVGEEWSPNPAIVAHWQGGKVNPNGYTSCLPSMMDFPLQIALTQGLIAEESFSGGLTQTYEMLANDFLYADPSNLVVFPDNHDMDRFFAQVNQDINLFRLGISFILTTRGIPQIYYGTELLMTNPGNGDHGLIREDFPGGWPNDPVNAMTGKGLTAEQKETKKFFKTLLQWRKDNAAIHNGKLMHYAPDNGIYVYFRYLGDQKVMVVLSKNEEEVTLDLSRFREILSEGEPGTEILTGKQLILDDELQVPARTPMIINVGKRKQRLSTAEIE